MSSAGRQQSRLSTSDVPAPAPRGAAALAPGITSRTNSVIAARPITSDTASQNAAPVSHGQNCVQSAYSMMTSGSCLALLVFVFDAIVASSLVGHWCLVNRNFQRVLFEQRDHAQDQHRLAEDQ